MASDAKLGLVMGLALVLTIGLVFHRRTPATGANGPASAARATATSAPATPSSPVASESTPFIPAAEPTPLRANQQP